MTSPYNNFENRFITLAGLELPGELPEALEAAGNTFVRKPEFHITLLPVERTAARIDEGRVEELRPQIADEFYQFVGNQPLTEYELIDDLRLVEASETNKTIIVLAALKGIDELFSTLSSKHGVEIPIQPIHITLYTLPQDRIGIPINSYEELERMSQPIELPEIHRHLGF